jgi:hypothetical protein
VVIAMLPDDKLEMVRIYLTGRCSLFSIEDYYDAKDSSQTFKLTHKDKIILVKVMKSFFDKHSLTDVILKLIEFRLAERIKKNSTKHIIITERGVDI